MDSERDAAGRSTTFAAQTLEETGKSVGQASAATTNHIVSLVAEWTVVDGSLTVNWVLKGELTDDEAVCVALDWATDRLAKTATTAEEAVAHRRELLQEMAARERKIDQRLAKIDRAFRQLEVT